MILYLKDCGNKDFYSLTQTQKGGERLIQMNYHAPQSGFINAREYKTTTWTVYIQPNQNDYSQSLAFLTKDVYVLCGFSDNSFKFYYKDQLKA